MADDDVGQRPPPDRTLWLSTLGKVATAITALVTLIRIWFTH